MRDERGFVCALQCDKMGVEWNSRFKKVRGLDSCETRPSGSDEERDMMMSTDRQREKEIEREMDHVGNRKK